MWKRKKSTDWVTLDRSSLSIIVLGVTLSLLCAPTLTAQGRDPKGTTVKIFSQILNEERTLSVSLPEDYEASQNIYPVLYVLDAEGPKIFPQCVSTLDNLQDNGTVPQMIAVGIWNTNRNRDMIPVVLPHRPGSGGSERFLSFLKEELVPTINRAYRTEDFSVLYGMSNSALFTVFALLEAPETFSAYIASSPTIGHCIESIESQAETFIKTDAASNRILYMIYGTKDSPRVTDFVPNFQNYLKSHAPRDFSSECVILEGEGHVPESSLKRGLVFIYSRLEK